MIRAIELVRDGKADAVISPGNTGALGRRFIDLGLTPKDAADRFRFITGRSRPPLESRFHANGLQLAQHVEAVGKIHL